MDKTSPSVAIHSFNTNEIERLILKVLNGLEQDGYIHIKEQLTEYEFQMISERLGPIRLRSDLRLDPKRDQAQEKRRVYTDADDVRPSIYKHLPLDFHNDSPRDVRLSWYCIEQDPKYGALWMVDSKNIMANFTEKEKDILSTIRLRYISIEDGVECQPWEQLLVREMGKEKVYFADWHLKDKYDDKQLKVIEKFQEYLRIETEHRKLSARLLPGESIYVDNRRMLHARGALSENSKRHIIRLAITSGTSS